MRKMQIVIVALLISGLTACTHTETASEKTTVPAPATVAVTPVEKGKCFAIGRAAFDKACYSFKTKKQCLETSVRHNCGWEGQ